MIYFTRSDREDIDIVETLKEICHRKRDGHTFNFAGRTSFVWNSTYEAAGVRKVFVRFDERLSREWRGNALYRQTGRLQPPPSAELDRRRRQQQPTATVPKAPPPDRPVAPSPPPRPPVVRPPSTNTRGSGCPSDRKRNIFIFSPKGKYYAAALTNNILRSFISSPRFSFCFCLFFFFFTFPDTDGRVKKVYYYHLQLAPPSYYCNIPADTVCIAYFSTCFSSAVHSLPQVILPSSSSSSPRSVASRADGYSHQDNIITTILRSFVFTV
ncbi:hypothetical protein AGLY_006694 [Aphis glycines]|uniref:Uncharacterized protein n=1 Tax=Aphis glycines TaxID=307491 RepID=A0A6G0TU41_APHGL|nr:hypothetical protein AGLY_006694 [Aphis glycines]